MNPTPDALCLLLQALSFAAENTATSGVKMRAPRPTSTTRSHLRMCCVMRAA